MYLLLLLLLKAITVGYRNYNFLIPTLKKVIRVQLLASFWWAKYQFWEDIPFCFKNKSLSKLLSDKCERFGTKMSPAVLKRRSYAAEDRRALLYLYEINEILLLSDFTWDAMFYKLIYLQKYLLNCRKTIKVFKRTGDGIMKETICFANFSSHFLF